MECPTIKSTMMSMLGKGKSSFRQALLRYLKFVHTLILFSGFDTGTMFDTH